MLKKSICFVITKEYKIKIRARVGMKKNTISYTLEIFLNVILIAMIFFLRTQTILVFKFGRHCLSKKDP